MAAGTSALVTCGSLFQKAAKIYTTIDTVAGLGAAAVHMANGTAGLGDVIAVASGLSYGASKLSGLPTNCFVAGTMVLVGEETNADGSVRLVTMDIADIADVEAGDTVLSRDQDDPGAPVQRKRVVQTFERTVDVVRVVQIKDASGNVETIRTTDEHPFWVEGAGWVEAGRLEAGQILDQQNGADAWVMSSTVELHPEGVRVYNFEVEEGHTYFVEDGAGEQAAVWVHNSCDPRINQLDAKVIRGRVVDPRFTAL